LSNEFFEEVTAHPIPTDLEAVKLLSSAPAVLDLFVWLSYRVGAGAAMISVPGQKLRQHLISANLI
jgi:hypothetical protein